MRLHSFLQHPPLPVQQCQASRDNGEDRSTGRSIMRERQLIRSNSAVQLAQGNLQILDTMTTITGRGPRLLC